jgi:hypothetical protein
MITFKDKDEERTWTSVVIAAIGQGGAKGTVYYFADADLVIEERRKRGPPVSTTQPTSVVVRLHDGDGNP